MNLITINENNVAWVEDNNGKIFGVVNAFEVLDEDGKKHNGKSVCDLIDCDQDWESEANLINFIFDNGESATLKVTTDGIELIDNNQ